MSPTNRPKPWRSFCAVARTLDIVGDKWSLLIVRDLLKGKRRYQELEQSPEGVTPSVLAERLKRLELQGITERLCYCEHPPRYEYHLTEKGRALEPVVKAIVNWGMTHLEGSRTT